MVKLTLVTLKCVPFCAVVSCVARYKYFTITPNSLWKDNTDNNTDTWERSERKISDGGVVWWSRQLVVNPIQNPINR